MAALLALAGCGLVGCGTGGPAPATSPAAHATTSPAQAAPTANVLLGRSITAVNKATSVRMSGTYAQGSATMSLNLILSRSGGTYGTMNPGTGGFTLLVSGGNAYIKVSAAFLRQEKLPTAACTLMCGKWLEMPASQYGLNNDFNWNGLFGQMDKSLRNAPSTVRAQGPVTVDGSPAWKLTDIGDTAAIYIAAQGTPYPVRIVGPHNQGSFTFSEWNTATIPSPPPASEVISLSQLSQLG